MGWQDGIPVAPAAPAAAVTPAAPVAPKARWQQGTPVTAAPAAPTAAVPNPALIAAGAARGAGLTGRGAHDEIDARTLVYPQDADTNTGAPWQVRMIVGSAQDQDKLANLQRFYPDAQPVPNKAGRDSGNFIYTNPDTGKKTLYNPPGLDLADVPSAGREMAQTAGATLGGAAGALESVPSAGIAAPVTVPLMAGVGDAAAARLWDAMMVYGPNKQINTETPAQAALNTTNDVLMGALGSGVGSMAGAGGKQLAKNMVGKPLLGDGAAERIATMEGANVTPTVGTVSNRKFVQGTQSALAYTPTSSDVIMKAAAKNTGEIASGAKAMTQRYSGGATTSAEDAGTALQEGAKGAAARFKDQQGRLYDTAYSMIGADTPTPVPNTQALYAKLTAQVAKAPNSLKGATTGLSRVTDVLKDSVDPVTGAPKPIAFGTLRDIRTEIGRELADPVLAGSSGAANETKKQLYAALSDDIDAIAGVNPAAKQVLDQANQLTKFNMTENIPLLDKVVAAKTPEKAYAMAMGGAQDGGTMLRNLRRNMTPEEWDVVSGTTLGKMGAANPGAQSAAGDEFSVNTFLTNWSKLSPEAKDALFSDGQYSMLRPELDRLMEASGLVKNLSKSSNPSGTARSLLYVQAVGTLGSMFVSPGATAVGVSSMVAPYTVAKLMTSPYFVHALADTAKLSPNGLGAFVGRLTSIAHQHPDLADGVGQYIQALQQNTQQTNSQPEGQPAAPTTP